MLPKEGNLPDRMNIYTVVSATYDEDENQTLYDANVPGLSDDNVFGIPENIKLVENAEYGKVIKYPFSLNK